MSAKFSEGQVHEYLYQRGLEALIEDVPEIDFEPEALVSPQEVVFTHNFAFQPTGILREAYTYYLNRAYEIEAQCGSVDDHSVLKINEIQNWLSAWQFMEMCGFSGDATTDSDTHLNPEDQQ